jgi:hypothetical protein
MVRWGAKESKECERQFNLFASTGGTQGWDPESTDAAYIKEKIIQQAKNPIFAPFLAKSAGGSARAHVIIKRLSLGIEVLLVSIL